MKMPLKGIELSESESRYDCNSVCFHHNHLCLSQTRRPKSALLLSHSHPMDLSSHSLKCPLRRVWGAKGSFDTCTDGGSVAECCVPALMSVVWGPWRERDAVLPMLSSVEIQPCGCAIFQLILNVLCFALHLIFQIRTSLTFYYENWKGHCRKGPDQIAMMADFYTEEF